MGSPRTRRERSGRGLGLHVGLALLALTPAVLAQGLAATDPATRVRELAAELHDPERAAAARDELRRLVDSLPAKWRGAAPPAADAWAFVTGAGLLLRPGASGDGAAGLADETLARAREVAEQLGDPATKAWLDYEAAAFQLRRGGLARAEELARAAVRAGPPTDRTRLAARHLLAEILRRRARWDEALRELDALESSLALPAVRASLGDAAWQASRAALHGARGDALRRMGLPDRAARELEEEGRAARASGDPRALVAHALHLADLRLLLEQFSLVASGVTEALGSPWSRGVGQEVRAQLRLTLGLARSEAAREGRADAREARELLGDVAAAPETSELHKLVAEVHLADLALRAGDRAEARRLVEGARVRAASIDAGADGIVHEVTMLATQEARVALAGDPSAGEIAPHVEPMRRAFEDLLGDWAATPARPGGIGFLNLGSRRQALSTLMRVEMAAEPGARGVERAFAHWLRAEAQGSLARREGAGPATLEEVQEVLLGPDRGALVYLPSKERSHLFVVDARGVAHLELASKDELRRPADALVAALAVTAERVADAGRRAEALERIGAAGEAVARRLLPPEALARLATWSGVTVVGLELIGRPAFECLAPGGGPPLGVRLAVDHLPALALGLRLARRAAEEGPRELDLVLGANLEPTPEARALASGFEAFAAGDGDLAALRAPFEPSRVRTLTGSAATPSALLRAAREAAVLHVLAHGVYDPNRERGAALALAPCEGSEAGLLGCDEVESGPPAPPLVVLSACGAARSPLRFGEDRASDLGGAFLGAGARVVVLSPRALEYGATLRLMAAFHEELAAGAAPAAALQRARRRLAASVPPLEALYLAQFEVVGLGHVPLRIPPAIRTGSRR